MGGGGEAHSSPCRIVYFFSPILQPRLNRFFFSTPLQSAGSPTEIPSSASFVTDVAVALLSKRYLRHSLVLGEPHYGAPHPACRLWRSSCMNFAVRSLAAFDL